MIFQLLKLQILNFFNFNIMLHTKDKKQKHKLIFVLVVFAVLFVSLFVFSFAYSYGIADVLIMLGALELLPAVMFLVVCLITLFTSIYKVGGILFSFRDYDMLMALPVSTATIVASRVLMLYVMNLSLTLLIMLPSGIAYAMKAGPSLLFYPIFLITLFFIPLIPIIIATIIGTIIIAVSSRFRQSNLINIILTLLLTFGITVFSFQMQDTDLNMSMLASLSKQLKEMLYNIYPVSRLYIESILNYNILSLLLFILVSLLPFGLYLLIVSRKYKSIATSLSTTSTKSNYKMQELKQTGIIGALYKKELRRYLSSPMYVLNTAISLAMLLVACVALFFIDPKKLDMILELPGFSDILNGYAPFIVAFMSAICCTTSSSISLEGKNLWILKCSPVSHKQIFLGKILLNLTITIPCCVICSLLLAINLHMDFVHGLLLFIVPILYSVLSAMIGLLVNLKLPHMNWTNELTVIKQSASTMFSSLFDLILAFLPFIPLIAGFNINPILLSVGTSVFIGVAIFIVYQILMQKGGKMLYSIQES